MDEAGEEWRTIPTFSKYQVSNLGRVRSLTKVSKGKLLSPGRKKTGYLFVNIVGDDGIFRTRHIHSLVALAFIGPRPDGAQVCHFDDNPANNTLANLRYDSPLGNGNDKRRAHGTIEQQANHEQKKLLWRAIVDRALQLARRGVMSQAAAGRMLGIDPHRMCRYASGEVIPTMPSREFLSRKFSQ